METQHGRLKELSPQEIEQVLDQSLVAHLGMQYRRDVYVVPVTYVRDGDFLYSHSREGKKLEIMRARPRVCLQIDQVQGIFKWRSVVVRAHFEELDGLEAAKGMRLLIHRIARDQQERNITPLELQISAILSHAVIYRFRIESVSGRAEGED